MERIYLDNNATTGVDPRVKEAMLEELTEVPANPSSVHFFGQAAKNKLSKARQTIANYFKVKAQEVIFTSGGTESLNMLIRPAKGHIITTNVEHAAVYSTLQALPNEVTYLPVGHWGAAQVGQIKEALKPQTSLIILSAVNSETGVKTDLEGVARLAREYEIPLVIDGVALLGKEPVVFYEGISAMAFSGHKIHGPKGVGFTLLRSSLKWPALLTGGGQEYSKRGGTENLPGIVGLAAAIDLLTTELAEGTQRMRYLRDLLESGLREKVGGLLINGEGPRIANTSNLAFTGVDGETLLLSLDMAGVSVSHGSACGSGALEPSRILTMMGLPRERARSSLRFTLSRWTSEAEIHKTIDIVSELALRLRTHL